VMEISEKIQTLRFRIDQIDEEILSLLNKRARLVLEMEDLKSKGCLEVYDPVWEEEILNRITSINSSHFPSKAISCVFREIISACRFLIKPVCVAYLGPSATHTHLACIEHFGSSIETSSKESIEEVFESVEKGESPFGVVPIENTIEGMVHRTLDMFMEYEVRITGEILLRISHDLLSQSGNPEDIQRIYSHSQAFAQCRGFLRKNYPHVPLIETESTAKAAQMAREDPSAGAISSSLSGRLYRLKTVSSRIEDFTHNSTRFLILGLKSPERTGRDKTSILFSIPDQPGALYQVLRVFSERGINLKKIESRPAKGRPWEYVFFIDFEGHSEDSMVKGALSEIKGAVLFLKVLGSYPRRV